MAVIERHERGSLRTWKLDRDAILAAHERVYQRIGERDLATIEATFQASPAELGRLFGGISRQAINKWLDDGVPAPRLADVGRVADVARRLRRTFRRERIPAIVRQPNPGLGGESVLEVLARTGGADRVNDALDRLTSYVPVP
jgi:hypothetical protein